MKVENILGTIGNTPIIKANRLFGNTHSVWIKLERANPGASIKDRIALAMIEDAEKKGILNPDSTIIEPTSGNTGVGLSLVAAVKGYKLILVMPESMSVERRRTMAAYGAKLVLTPKELGIKGSILKAEEIAKDIPNSWIPQQFNNPANVEVHRDKTGQEILNDFPNGVDFLIACVGTGGHISGCAEALKRKFPKTKAFAVEPTASPVLSGGKHSPHPIQGIGTGFIPNNYKAEFIDGIIQVESDAAFEFARRAAREEGLFIGPSSGAALAAVSKKLSEIPKGSTVLTFCYDTGERYLSVENLFTDK